VDTITVHVGNILVPDPQNILVKQNIERIEDSLSKILPAAEKAGITVCIENIWFPTNTPEVLLSIKEHFPTDALGFCFDAGHANLCAKGKLYSDGGNRGRVWTDVYGKMPEIWDDRIGEKMLPHIVNCHLHDNNGDTDQHLCPGHGNVNWESVADLLRRAPRLKNIQSEVILSRDPVAIRSLQDSFSRILPECF
jgi:sugar phosphate isomerase/epimerase